MFVFLGIGEKGGSGSDVIIKGWTDNHWDIPTIAEINKIAPILENLRMDGVNQHRWKPYYNLVESFTSYDYLTFDNRTIMKRTFDLGYCSTIHKSQGSSYNKVYIDLNNLQICKDPLVRRQLEYVAFSRTRTDVNVFEQQR